MKRYIVEVENALLTSQSVWIGEGVEMQYRAANHTIEIWDGIGWEQAVFSSVEEAKQIARIINSYIPIETMHFDVKELKHV